MDKYCCRYIGLPERYLLFRCRFRCTLAVKGGKHSPPVVTGMFNKDDVLASTAEMIADLSFALE